MLNSQQRIGGNPLEIRDLSSYLRLHLGLIIHGPPQQPYPGPPPPKPPSQQAPVWCCDHFTFQPPSMNGSTDETSTFRTTATIPQFRHEAHQTVSPLLWPQSAIHEEHGLSICMSATGDPQRILGAPIPATCPRSELPRKTTADAVPFTRSEHLAPFLTIPTEILDLILADLSPRSVVSLHDCCKPSQPVCHLINGSGEMVFYRTVCWVIPGTLTTSCPRTKFCKRGIPMMP